MTMRQTFVDTVTAALDDDPRLAVVTADISAAAFAPARARHPHRVLNVGIREQAMVGVAGGLALTGMRPVVHSYTPFLVERPFEQIKLDLGHQDVGAVLVSIGGSYDDPVWGRTHQGPGDVALLDTLPGWTVHVPGHPDEVAALLPAALTGDDRVYLRLSTRQNSHAHPTTGGFTVVRAGGRGTVVAVGPVLDNVLAATADLDVTVLYASTVRPFDRHGLRAAGHTDVVLVESYLAGTSAHEVTAAFDDVGLRLRALGVRRDIEVRAYGTAEEHDAVHGLDPQGIAAAVREFIR
ncbi:transketolase [Actinophytocola sp.]|uniref:transketolase family protein n=1 Tax=Actinophytocola sp. TaxID=1872138 RepID=UPI002ED29469